MKIDDKYNWLARDEDEDLFSFINKPSKELSFGEWITDDGYEGSKRVFEKDSTYSFIKWEDEQPTSLEYAKEVIETVDISHFGRTLKEPIKTRQVLVKFFDNEEYRTELTEESARELIEFLEANKK